MLADGCLFLDRLRTHSKNAFDWGMWGGGCVAAKAMCAAVGLKRATLARLPTSLLPIPVIGSIACGDQRLSCSMCGSMVKD